MKSPNVVVPLPTQVGGLAGTAALNDAASQSSWAMTLPGFADATAAMTRTAATTATSTETRIALIALPSSVFACLTSGVPDGYAAAVRPDCSHCAPYSCPARSHRRPTPGYPERHMSDPERTQWTELPPPATNGSNGDE